MTARPHRTARLYRLELRQDQGRWHARLLPLPGRGLPTDGTPDPPVWVEFETPLALLEWLEHDLPLDATFRGLR